MRTLAESLILMFSTYSRFPMPKLPYRSREAERLSFCFLPLVGVALCILLLLWHRICSFWHLSPLLFSAVAAITPVWWSGGVHMEGYMGTCEGLASHGVMDHKRAVLHRSQPGKAGILAGMYWFLLSLGLFTQLYYYPRLIILPAAGYILSRSLFSLSIALLPGEVDVAAGAVRWSCGVTLGIGGVVCLTASFLGTILTAAGLGLLFLWFRRICIWEYGENSTALAGWLLHGADLVCLAAAGVAGAVLYTTI